MKQLIASVLAVEIIIGTLIFVALDTGGAFINLWGEPITVGRVLLINVILVPLKVVLLIYILRQFFHFGYGAGGPAQAGGTATEEENDDCPKCHASLDLHTEGRCPNNWCSVCRCEVDNWDTHKITGMHKENSQSVLDRLSKSQKGG